MVLLMSFEMLRQLEDSLAQKRDLHLWRTRIGLVNPIITDCCCLNFVRQCHSGMDTPRSFLNLTFRRYDGITIAFVQRT